MRRGELEEPAKGKWREGAGRAGVPGTPGCQGFRIQAVCVFLAMRELVINGCHYVRVTAWGGGRAGTGVGVT